MNKVIHRLPLILASQSSSRAKILQQVGIEFEAVPSEVDESVIKKRARLEGKTIEETALELARAKACRVSKEYPGRLVVGADQMMVCEDVWFDKAGTVQEAREQLRFIRGKKHRLVSACVLFCNYQEIWSTVVSSELTCRDFSDEFVEFYVAHLGDKLLRSVGCYQVEGMGAQLFDKIEGDIFTIMGIPVLDLMVELRRQGILMS
jgi:septum formation protein